MTKTCRYYPDLVKIKQNVGLFTWRRTCFSHYWQRRIANSIQ